MHEYIKRSDAIAEINRGDLLVGNNAEWAREIIWRTPYADVAEVKHGKWIWKDFEGDGFCMLCCSECLETEGARENANYCHHCGARMDRKG